MVRCGGWKPWFVSATDASATGYCYCILPSLEGLLCAVGVKARLFGSWGIFCFLIVGVVVRVLGWKRGHVCVPVYLCMYECGREKMCVAQDGQIMAGIAAIRYR